MSKVCGADTARDAPEATSSVIAAAPAASAASGRGGGVIVSLSPLGHWGEGIGGRCRRCSRKDADPKDWLCEGVPSYQSGADPPSPGSLRDPTSPRTRGEV